MTGPARLIILLGALCLVFPTRAYAYIDPGAGSYMLQIAIATALAGAYALKLYWRRLWSAMGRALGKTPQHDADKP
jgi:hypothetical protein